MFCTHHKLTSTRIALSSISVAASLSLLYFGTGTSIAHAHAILLSSTPAQGENLPALPAYIVLEFTEPVGLEFSTIDLFGSGSKELPGGQLTRSGARDTTIALPTRGQSASGVVYVVWRVVSGIDGHLTTGSYWFTVGDEFANARPDAGSFPGQEDASAAPFGGTSAGPDLPRLLARFIILASSALLLGGSVFTVLVMEPSAISLGSPQSEFDRRLGIRFAAIGVIVACALVLALLMDLVAQTATVAGTDYLGAFGDLELTQQLLSSTRYGLAWVLKLLSALVLASIMLFAWASRKATNAWEVAIAAASLLLLAEALSSHAAAAQSGSIGGLPVPVISDWLHLVVASLWAGGLLYMVTTLFPVMKQAQLDRHKRSTYLHEVITRFSRLAIASVLLLAITGSYNLLVHTTDVRALFDGDYGWVLAVKVGLFIAVVSLGARNFQLFRPSRDEATVPQEGGAEGKLTRNVRLEVLLLLAAFLSAGALTLLPPPTAKGVTPSPNQTSTNVSTLASTKSGTGAYDVLLSVNQIGAEEFFEVALDAKTVDAPSLTDVTKAFLRITPQEGRTVTSSVETIKVSDLTEDRTGWRASSSLTARAGTYLVTLVAQRRASDDVKVGFSLTRESNGDLSITPWDVIELRISTEPNPPVVGENTLHVKFVSAAGKPIDEATGLVKLEYPASGQTTTEYELTPANQKDGALSSRVRFERTGAWRIIVRVQRPGQQDILLDASLDVVE